MEDRGEDHSQHKHEAGDTPSASEDSAPTGQTARWVDLDVVSTIDNIYSIYNIQVEWAFDQPEPVFLGPELRQELEAVHRVNIR